LFINFTKKSGMHIFITGADGLLGSNLVRELLKRNYKVRALIQPGRKVNTLEGLEIERVEGDLLNAESIIKAMEGCDHVLHAAASTSVWPERNPFVRRVNIEGTQNIIKAAEHHKIKRMVYVGTANTFGFGTIDNPGHEGKPYSGTRYKLDYMDSKHQAHQVVMDAVKRGLDAVVCNPTFMLGPYDSAPSSGALILAIYRKQVPGYAPGGRNYICVKDAAIGIANAFTMGRTGESYIIGNENLSYKEAFTKMAGALGVKPPGIGVPRFALLMFGRWNSMIGKIRGKDPKLSLSIAKISCDQHYFTAEKAVRELKLPQTPVEEGIKEALEWFRENKYL
jgi:dihydroflavonol-4-reductase